MKTFLVFFSLLLSTATLAQKKELENVKFALEVLRMAMVSGDRIQLMQITTPQLSYGHSSGLVETQEQFVEKLASGTSDFVKIDISNETISVYKNSAVVRHDLYAQTNDSGNPGTVKLHVLLFWVETKAGWQLAARQAIKIP